MSDIQAQGNGFAPVPPEHDSTGATASEWAKRQFEHSYCEECHGDAEDHNIVIGPTGAWFAHCKEDDASQTVQRREALELARDAQTEFWDALRQLERALGVDLDNADSLDLSNQTVESLLESADQPAEALRPDEDHETLANGGQRLLDGVRKKCSH